MRQNGRKKSCEGWFLSLGMLWDVPGMYIVNVSKPSQQVRGMEFWILKITWCNFNTCTRFSQWHLGCVQDMKSHGFFFVSRIETRLLISKFEFLIIRGLKIHWVKGPKVSINQSNVKITQISNGVLYNRQSSSIQFVVVHL